MRGDRYDPFNSGRDWREQLSAREDSANKLEESVGDYSQQSHYQRDEQYLEEVRETVELTQRVVGGIGAHLRRAILGRDRVIELVILALLADGHILLEDYPGSGKTTLAKALGESIYSTESKWPVFRRIQFTPDLLPSDITGVSIFIPQTSDFRFTPGPIFSHIVLADEINRTPPKVQAAMLEAMGEKQVTADGRKYRLDELFFVIATQNPLDVSGTYPLPSPQLDRFLFKIQMDYIDPDSELQVLALHLRMAKEPPARLTPVAREEILKCRSMIAKYISVPLPIRRALVEFANNIRRDPRVLQGVSTRSLVLAQRALQVRAAMSGRGYVSPDDLRFLIPYLFGHRIERAPGSPEPEVLLREAATEPMERLVQTLLSGGDSGGLPPTPLPPSF